MAEARGREISALFQQIFERRQGLTSAHTLWELARRAPEGRRLRVMEKMAKETAIGENDAALIMKELESLDSQGMSSAGDSRQQLNRFLKQSRAHRYPVPCGPTPPACSCSSI